MTSPNRLQSDEPDPTGETTPKWVLRLPFFMRMPVMLVVGPILWLINKVRGKP